MHGGLRCRRSMRAPAGANTRCCSDVPATKADRGQNIGANGPSNPATCSESEVGCTKAGAEAHPSAELKLERGQAARGRQLRSRQLAYERCPTERDRRHKPEFQAGFRS